VQENGLASLENMLEKQIRPALSCSTALNSYDILNPEQLKTTNLL